MPLQQSGIFNSPEETLDFCPGTFYIDICRIGNADSFLLWKNTDFMLVDTGNSINAEDIIGLLIKRQVTRLKALTITHFDSDHMGAYLSIIDYMNSIKRSLTAQTIEHIYARKYTAAQLDIIPKDRYKNYVKFINGILRYLNRYEEEFDLEVLPDSCTLAAKAEELFDAGTGLWIFPYKTNLNSHLSLDDTVQIWWLNRFDSYLKAGVSAKAMAGNINNDSLIFKVIYSDKSVLFLGDMGQSGLNDLLLYNSFYLRSDILKIAHHGHKHSSPKYFIEEVCPVISLVTTTLKSTPDNAAFGNRLEELISEDINFGTIVFSGDVRGDYSTIAIRYVEPKIFTANTSIIGYRP